MQDQLKEIKQRALRNLALWVAVIVVTFYLFKGYGCLVLAGIVGFALWLSARNVIQLIRAAAMEHEHSSQVREEFRRQFHRATTLPRQVFMLLLGVAEVDGASDRQERELVRQFVLQRFTSPVDANDLRVWEAARVPREQLPNLAAVMRGMLSNSECDTVFAWCCLVAFADGSFNPEEHMALQEIARGFGMEPYHARRIFHHARQSHLRGATGADFDRQGAPGGSQPRGAVSGRLQALAVLGLEEGTTAEEIRSRHRELVKRYHPDKHVHLGPVAAKEAEERFREVQAAYEVLGG